MQGYADTPWASMVERPCASAARRGRRARSARVDEAVERRRVLHPPRGRPARPARLGAARGGRDPRRPAVGRWSRRIGRLLYRRSPVARGRAPPDRRAGRDQDGAADGHDRRRAGGDPAARVRPRRRARRAATGEPRGRRGARTGAARRADGRPGASAPASVAGCDAAGCRDVPSGPGGTVTGHEFPRCEPARPAAARPPVRPGADGHGHPVRRRRRGSTWPAPRSWPRSSSTWATTAWS